ncbi:tryptophan-rich sensory protein [Leptolyngbya sp. KIOST-1]|uniref:tryptophan-rich sensory protein n=1 Tax=Leptolyngbya sp. KIOST-1 TaxID=1229172 RepID=UPI00068ECD30|nr:tryptophan-rich sensory protein [Leptolyngbya sp. KIOST-1]
MDTPQHHSPSGKGLAIATAVAIVATLAINTLSNAFPPGGQNIGEIANTQLVDVLIIPASYAFSIWGLIYLGLLAYGLYQFNRERRSQPDIQRVNQLLIVACIAQVIWIFLFTLEQFGWSILAMLGILLPLIGAYRTFNIGRDRPSRQRRWMAHIPFSIYLAWISVATIVNVAAALYASPWDGWGLTAVTWTVAMVVVVTLLGAVVIYRRQDVAFTLVFVWALVAIAVRQSETPAVLWAALIAAGVLLIGLAVARFALPHPPRPKPDPN